MRNPSIVRRLPPNLNGRDFYIGDLHGCTDHLTRLLEYVAFDPSSDRVFSVGDLVDRGPDSLGATEFLDTPWFFAVLGNHEIWSLSQLQIAPYTEWEERLRYSDHLEWHGKLQASERAQLIERLKSLPLALEIEQPQGGLIGVIHAMLPIKTGWSALYDVDVDDMLPQSPRVGTLVWDVIRGREQAALEGALGLRSTQGYERGLARNSRSLRRRACRTPGIDLLISGHVITPNFEPVVIANRLSIDTGVYRPMGRLTMVEPATRRYWQVGWRKNLKTPLRHVHCGTLTAPYTAWDVRLSLRRILASEAAGMFRAGTDGRP